VLALVLAAAMWSGIAHREYRPPAEVWIAGTRWQIEFAAESLDIYGETFDDLALIRISGGLDPEIRRAALFHELLHARLTTAANGHPADEEDCVLAQEVAGLSMWRDPRNDRLRAYLLP